MTYEPYILALERHIEEANTLEDLIRIRKIIPEVEVQLGTELPEVRIALKNRMVDYEILRNERRRYKGVSSYQNETIN